MGHAHDPRRAIDGRAEVIVVAPLDHAQVQAAAHADRDAVGDRGVDQRLLERHRGLHGVERVVEGGEQAVAGRLDDDAAVAFDGHPGPRIVLREGAGHALALLFPQTGAALDVREQDGDYAGRHIQSGVLRAAVAWPALYNRRPAMPNQPWAGRANVLRCDADLVDGGAR